MIAEKFNPLLFKIRFQSQGGQTTPTPKEPAQSGLGERPGAPPKPKDDDKPITVYGQG
jgi:hypothetical protein